MVVVVSTVVSKFEASGAIGSISSAICGDFVRPSTGLQGSRATAPQTSILLCRLSLAASPQVACSPVVLRWPEHGDLVGFLEKS
jgi:hypothetical protein